MAPKWSGKAKRFNEWEGRIRDEGRKDEGLDEINDLEEPVSGGVIDPRVIVRASYTRLQIDCLAWNLFTCQFTGMRHPTGGFAFHGAFLRPGLKVFHFAYCAWILNPLNDLRHRDEIDVVVVGEYFVNPVEERVKILGVVLEPGCVEV